MVPLHWVEFITEGAVGGDRKWRCFPYRHTRKQGATTELDLAAIYKSLPFLPSASQNPLERFHSLQKWPCQLRTKHTKLRFVAAVPDANPCPSAVVSQRMSVTSGRDRRDTGLHSIHCTVYTHGQSRKAQMNGISLPGECCPGDRTWIPSVAFSLPVSPSALALCQKDRGKAAAGAATLCFGLEVLDKTVDKALTHTRCLPCNPPYGPEYILIGPKNFP